VRSLSKNFDGTLVEASTVFDARGRQKQVTKTVSSGAGTGSATARYFYDAMNRVTQEQLPDGNTVDTVYNGLTTTVTRTNTTGSAGNNVPRISSKTANAKGLVANVDTLPLATQITYAYDAIGNLTQVVSPGANGSFVTKLMSYDNRGRQTSLTDPDAGTYYYVYNGAGEQTEQRDSRSPTQFVTRTQYDSFGRKTGRTETHPLGGGLADTVWSYDCANAKGMLCSVGYSAPGTSGATAVTTKTTTFDIYSRPAATTTVIDGQSFVSSIAYDNLGRPKHAVYPQATSASAPLALTTLYNASGYATEVKHATTGQSYWKVDVGGRNDDGQLKTATLGGTLTINHGYSNTDNLGRIATVNVTSGSNPLLAQTFDFESVGNLKGRTLTGGSGASARAEAETFGYDTLDRLLQSGGSGITDTGSNTIDLAGNLTSKAGLPLGYQSSSNRLCAIGASTCGAGTGNIAYDGNGNIQSYTRPTAAQSNNTPGADGAFLQLNGYTAFNLPTSITKSIGGAVTASAEFFYDAGYQRTRQIKRAGPTQTGAFVDDILYVVPGGFEVHRNNSGQIIKSIATISGSDGVVATVSTNFDAVTGLPLVGAAQAATTSNNSGLNTVTQLILKDHLGSMVAEITLGGTATNPVVLLNTHSIHGFGPWGNARNGLNADQRGFTGHEHLAELGLIHMNGRLYDPVLGRFLQADPIIQAPHNAQSHNRYSYVLNNPLSFSDPSGFSAWTQWRSTIFAIAAAFIVPWAITSLISAGIAQGASWALSFAVDGGLGTLTIGTAGNAVAAVAGGFAAGGIAGGNIQSALQGALTAGLTFGLATAFDLHGAAGFGTGKHVGQIALHTAMGCASSAMAGGSCRAGAISGATSAFASPLLPADKLGRLAGSAAIGTIAAKLSGGNAQNGALSAAFGYLFNEVAHNGGKGYDASTSGPTDKLNLFSPLGETGMWLSAVRDKGIDGFFNVYAHGTASGLWDGQQTLDETATRKLFMDKGWAGQPVALFSCNCGGAGYAQRLSNILGVEVLAPDGFYNYYTDGSGRAGTYRNSVVMPPGAIQSRDPNIGSMRPFWPVRN
jgi:RHS repeat-associated protein